MVTKKGAGKNGRPRKPRPRFKVGDWIAFTSGPSRRVAQVIEYRGRFGRDELIIYRVCEPVWYSDPARYEIMENDIELATEADLAMRYPPEDPRSHASESR